MGGVKRVRPPFEDYGKVLHTCKVDLWSQVGLNGKTYYGLRLTNDRGGCHEFGGTDETPERALRWLYEVGVFLETWLLPVETAKPEEQV